MAVTCSTGRLKVTLAGATHVGRKRAHNEDSFALSGEDRLAVVADGMGGHASGEVASKIAVETVAEYFRATAGEERVLWPYRVEQGLGHQKRRLATAVKLANAKIWETAHAESGKHGMGTTVAAALFFEGKAVIAHVGDSRVYRLRDRVIEQLTDDHSLVNDWLRMKGLQAGEAVNFPQKNVIVRALGMKESVAVDLLVDAMRPDDYYVVCSDGLSGMIDDDTILRLVWGEGNLDSVCKRLIDAANEAGGQDNITALVARVLSS